MAKVYIIWDNSNIHYGGLNQVFPIKEPGQQKEFIKIFCENWQNPVKQRITPHFLTTSPSNYYEFTTKE